MFPVSPALYTTKGLSKLTPRREKRSLYARAERICAGTPFSVARRVYVLRYSAPGRWPFRYVKTSDRTSINVNERPPFCHAASSSVESSWGRGGEDALERADPWPLAGEAHAARSERAMSPAYRRTFMVSNPAPYKRALLRDTRAPHYGGGGSRVKQGVSQSLAVSPPWHVPSVYPAQRQRAL